jgi:serine/threonine-protein kinase ULK/ATG1
MVALICAESCCDSIQLWVNINNAVLICVIDPVERLTVEEFVHHPFLSEHAPERTLSRTPSDIRDLPSSQSSQEDCMPFPLDDESSGQDESPVPDSKSPMKSYGFPMGKRLDKTSGQSPSKHIGLFSRYVLGNNHPPSSQHHDHAGKKTKESNIDEVQGRKGGYPEDSPIIDSLEFVDQEYVFVSGPHPEGSSSSTNASRQLNLPAKYDNSSVSPPKLTLSSAPMPINGVPINRQQSAGTGSLDSHCSPASGTSQGSADMSDAIDQPPSDYLTRIRLLEQYASAIAGLVKDEIKAGRHLEAFSIQLIVLATWKQAIHLCNTFVASAARESPSQDIPMKGLCADVPHLLANSQLVDDACMQIERRFLSDVEYAEELASTVGQIADGTEMPDAIEIIFQSALHIGRRGGVDEMFGKAADAKTGYTRAVSMLRFLLIEAPLLALNPPLTLTRSDRHRLRTYIEALNTRLGQMHSQSH